jgi:hypothetical protein
MKVTISGWSTNPSGISLNPAMASNLLTLPARPTVTTRRRSIATSNLQLVPMYRTAARMAPYPHPDSSEESSAQGCTCS